MFIELHSINPVMVNTDAIAYLAPQFERDFVKDKCMITFKNPISSKGGNKILVQESYEEVKRMIMEGK